MQNRNEIMWAPFSSVINGKIIIKKILDEKSKIDKPILSEDQINELNEKIFEAYTNHIKINIYIYNNSRINKINGYVNNISISKKYMTFNKSHIYFNQIIKVD